MCLSRCDDEFVNDKNPLALVTAMTLYPSSYSRLRPVIGGVWIVCPMGKHQKATLQLDVRVSRTGTVLIVHISMST